MSNLNYQEISKEYLDGMSLTKLATKYNITRWTLTKKLRELGIEIVNRQNIAKFDEHIFDNIDTEEKAYWLGFIYADGNISSITENTKRYEFELSLKGSDINHLQKFNKFMKYKGNNVKVSKVKVGGKEYDRCRWQVGNKHMWEVLNNYGCTPRKSLTLKFPDFSIFKDKTLIRHFIRGYFDGDGSLSRHISAHTVSLNCSVIGTPEFIGTIENLIKLDTEQKKDKRWTGNTVYLYFHHCEDMTKFINYLYKNSTIYLDRKYKLYNFFKNGSRSLEEFNELQSGKIKKSPEKDNPEITSEDLQVSEVLHSIGSEKI